MNKLKYFPEDINIIKTYKNEERILEIQFSSKYSSLILHIDKDFPNLCFVYNLVTDNNVLRHGHASRLLGYAEYYAQEGLNCDQITMEAKRGSFCKEWYERLGYKVVMAYEDDERVVMTKKLDVQYN